MEASLRNRLTFGPIMLLGLVGLLWLDANFQGMTRQWTQDYFGYRQFEPNKFEMPSGVGGLGLLIILAIVLPIATKEIGTLFAAERVKPYPLIAALGSGAIVLHAFLTQFPPFKVVAASALAFIVAFIPLLAALRRAWDKQTQEAIVRMAGTVLASLYLGGLGWFLMAIRVKQGQGESGFKGTTAIILMILLMVKFTDIGAYFGGRALGRHKLIPWLSPGKTWEGLFCGLATAAGVGALFALGAGTNGIPANWVWWRGVVFGVVIGGIGQAGDLLESMMKRDAEVKDSGKLVPGFGGVLDIIDSPLLAAPFAYLMFSLV
ncbi:phosphatidate cytidylyltransferase [Humisphaera borealis]|uniref:Phosphatidate cytidylyltransferase n=1 Tax=Humisphaera borealis TaxID=2807512 RepID=A0A7M2X0S3_9BACT|nr:phosphatidate cytidylyltransferase [Humisphaera borealis]QOV90711.1 phosphatidate cytidylyltransferase [Humisphaera borealis]